MLQLIKPNKLGSAIKQMDIVDISSDIVQLTNNRYRMIIKLSSINFELKSEEQDTILYTYESFLNSIGFPIQILVRTRAIDIDDYIAHIKQKETMESDRVYKQQLGNYRNFVKSLIKNNKILSKNFYVIIPFDSPKKTDLSLIKEQISVRSDIVQKSLNRMAIFGYPLSSLEIIDLFYSFYNPLKAKIQPISDKYLLALDSTNIAVVNK